MAKETPDWEEGGEDGEKTERGWGGGRGEVGRDGGCSCFGVGVLVGSRWRGHDRVWKSDL